MVSEITSINPLTQARPVDDPEITKVQDLHTGKILDVKEFIARHRYDEFIATVRVPVREDFKKEVYLYACALCGTPVYVVASPDKRFFFRHAEEDGSCSARTRGTLSMQEIRARQYFGQRESEAHKRIKRLIERSLIVDRDFQTIALETVWRAARDLKARRQPDVQVESARFGRIAFEAQISNSFLDEIAGRRVFYRENGGLLVWVLGHFLPEYRRLAIEDILFTNNSNVFVVDEETARLSEQRHAFHMRCFFRRPLRDGATIVDQWAGEIVAFADLTRDVATQTAFFFDYTGEEKRLRAAIASDAEAEREGVDEALREKFFALWAAAPQFHERENSELHASWNELSSTLEARGIKIPYRDPDYDSGFRALINGVLSARDGRPTGWKFDTLLQVAHCIFDKHKEHLFAFGCAIQLYGRGGLLEAQDKRGKWADRRAMIKEELSRYGSDFQPDSHWLAALLFLFPLIGQRVKARVDLLEHALSDFEL